MTSVEQIRRHLQTFERNTPFFFTSRAILKSNYDAYLQHFPESQVFYALKANSDPKLLLYLDSLGCGFEAASAHEIDILLDLGIDPAKIIYGTSVKPPTHIAKSFTYGVTRFAADSTEEIAKIARFAPGARVYVRSIVDDRDSVFTMSEKFGTPAHMIIDLVLFARHLGLKTYGISFYVGSQARHSDRWAKGIRTIKPAIEKLQQEGITFEVINIGGGFPVVYENHKGAPELHIIGQQVQEALAELPYRPRIILEPGRGIVATSTVLVTEIIARAVRQSRPWLYVDGGIYNALYEAMIHQGETQYAISTMQQEQDILRKDEYTEFAIAGPTGDGLDVITKSVMLPPYLDIGDKLIFENTGAYTLSMASRFNGFPEPKLYIG